MRPVECALLVLALGLSACGGDDDGADLLDAPVVPIDAPTVADNGVATCGKASIFLSFGGFIMDYEEVDDARENQSSNSNGTIESLTDVPWTEALTADVGARLAAYRIPMSVTRPDQGNYTMIAFDNDPSDSMGTDRWRFPYPTDCASANPNNVVLLNGPMFVAMDPLDAGSLVMYAIGRTVGLNDVMALQNCQFITTHDSCTFADDVMTTGSPCPATRQNQLQILSAAFGCP